MPSTTRTFASALVSAITVSAHGFVSNVVINGVSYSGYDVTNFPYNSDPPTVIGWSSEATDLGFVAPDAFGDADIICHRGSQNAGGFATVAAGDSLYLQWNTWPESHHGPVIDYLASCGDVGCGSVDKTSLEFFKISEKGLIDGSGAPGTYASDELMDNELGWMVKIPEDIAPGNYVLRHEIIALHSAGDANGAQNYPQCFSLQVTGSGTRQPDGVLGTSLYTADEEGILFNIYTPLDDYPIPGPAIPSGYSAVAQTVSAVESTGTATVGSGDAPAPAPTSGNGGNDDEETPAPQPTGGNGGNGGESSVEPTPAPTPVPSTTTSAVDAPEQTQSPPDTCALKKRSKKSKKAKKAKRALRA